LHPTLVLKALGCENIIYVTRQSGESPFAINVAKQLGLTESDERKLYSLNTDDKKPASSFLKSLQNADAIWCTNWNAYDTFDPEQLGKLIQDGYDSPLIIKSSWKLKPIGKNPVKTTRSTDLEGCH
jgi:hypothetical protein